jgi:hypothetical protein
MVKSSDRQSYPDTIRPQLVYTEHKLGKEWIASQLNWVDNKILFRISSINEHHVLLRIEYPHKLATAENNDPFGSDSTANPCCKL